MKMVTGDLTATGLNKGVQSRTQIHREFFLRKERGGFMLFAGLGALPRKALVQRYII
jgi:hypothetical protein